MIEHNGKHGQAARQFDDRWQLRFANQGVELQASPSPDAFTAYLKAEYTRWAKVMEDAGIKPE